MNSRVAAIKEKIKGLRLSKRLTGNKIRFVTGHQDAEQSATLGLKICELWQYFYSLHVSKSPVCVVWEKMGSVYPKAGI